MSNLNRAQRRQEGRKAKRKTGVAALSLLATTSLLSSYVSVIRSQVAYANPFVPTTGNCEPSLDASDPPVLVPRTLQLTLSTSGDVTRDLEELDDLQAALDTADVSAYPCVTITVTGEATLNFAGYNYENYASEAKLLTLEGFESVLIRGEGDRPVFWGTTLPNTGIQANGGTNLEIENIAIREFDGDAAIIVSDTSITDEVEPLYVKIENSYFYSNEGGGAVSVFSEGGVNLQIVDSEFRRNEAEDGGAVKATLGDEGDGGRVTVDVTRSQFHDNYAWDDGGAIYVSTDETEDYSEGVSLSVIDSNFTDNFSYGDGGAIYVDSGDDSGNELLANQQSGVFVSGSTFYNNYASDNGGAIFATQEDSPLGLKVEVSNSNFFENLTDDDDGGAIFAYSSSDVTIDMDTSLFSRNDASDGYGGAIYAYSLDNLEVNTSYSTFSWNLSEYDGGAIWLKGQTVNLVAYESRFEGNFAFDEGGAIYSYSNGDNVLQIDNSDFLNNNAEEDGGAIYVDTDDGNFYGSLNLTTFQDNDSDEDGGALYIYSERSHLGVYLSDFIGNSAVEDGGAIHLGSYLNTQFSSYRSDFVENESKTRSGGALSIGGSRDYFGELGVTLGAEEIVDVGGNTYPRLDDTLPQPRESLVRTSDGNLYPWYKVATEDGDGIRSDFYDFGAEEDVTFLDTYHSPDFGDKVQSESTNEILILDLTNSGMLPPLVGSLAVLGDEMVPVTGVIEIENDVFYIIIDASENEGFRDGGSLRPFYIFANYTTEARASIIESSFEKNFAFDEGGAIDIRFYSSNEDSSQQNLFEVVRSKFRENVSGGGGDAVDGYANRIEVSNSTFFDNGNGDGKNFWGTDSKSALFVHNTFLANDTFSPYSFEGQSNLILEGNIFASTFFDPYDFDGIHNLATADSLPDTPDESEFYEITSLAALALAEQPDYHNSGLSGVTATIPITSARSSALDKADPGDYSLRARTIVGGVDQRGAERVGNYDIGAFEGVLVPTVNNNTGGGGGFAVPTVAVVAAKPQTVVPGFGANSTRLTAVMKKKIRAFVRANPDVTSVTCKAFTSEPATLQDSRLARERAKVTCAFIKKLNPEVEVKVLKGGHTFEQGSKARRVRIVME